MVHETLPLERPGLILLPKTSTELDPSSIEQNNFLKTITEAIMSQISSSELSSSEENSLVSSENSEDDYEIDLSSIDNS